MEFLFIRRLRFGFGKSRFVTFLFNFFEVSGGKFVFAKLTRPSPRSVESDWSRLKWRHLMRWRRCRTADADCACASCRRIAAPEEAAEHFLCRFDRTRITI